MVGRERFELSTTRFLSRQPISAECSNRAEPPAPSNTAIDISEEGTIKKLREKQRKLDH